MILKLLRGGADANASDTHTPCKMIIDGLVTKCELRKCEYYNRELCDKESEQTKNDGDE